MFTRDLIVADAEPLAALVIRNREFLRPWEPARPDSYFSVEGQATVVASDLARREAGLMLPRVILDESGAVAGRINVNNIVGGAFCSASIGYWLDEASGGRGLARRALAEIVAVAFGQLGLHRVEAGTIPSNVRSQAVLESNGFVRFGYAPSYLQIDGVWTDHILFQKLTGP